MAAAFETAFEGVIPSEALFFAERGISRGAHPVKLRGRFLGPLVQARAFGMTQSFNKHRIVRVNMRHIWPTFFLLLTSLPLWPQNRPSAELTVATAADLRSALKEVAEAYESKSGVKVRLVFGSSGALTQQIQQGAPFDVFFSADMDYPRQLISAGDAEANTLHQYAVGKLVLWVPADSTLDIEHQGMKVLLDSVVRKIAIANPQHAPYGRAAVAALKHEGVYDWVANRLVMGENVSQAAQFVESGNADAGFIALAHAVAPAMQGKGKYWRVPDEDYPPLEQGVVVLTHSQHKKEAAEFLESIKSKDVAEIFRKYGFTQAK